MTGEEYAKLFREIPEPRAKPLWVRDFQSMVIHTRGEMKSYLIDKRRPNETEDVKAYRVENDRPITRNAFIKAITNLQRTISHSSVEFRFPDNLTATLNQPIFEDTNFLSFFQRKVVGYMCEAANACLVWWPEGVGDTTRQVSIVPHIVMPEKIIHYTSEVFTWLSDEKSLVMFGGREQMVGDVYYVMLKDELWKRVQIGKKTDERFEFVSYYVNPIKEIYALPLGGDETSAKDKDGKEVLYYTSFLSSAVPFADECKVQFSDHQGVMVNCSSPLREVEAIECTECQGRKKLTYGGGLSNCLTCNGTGHMPISPGPYGMYVRPKRKEGPMGEKDTSDIPMMRFLHPDTAILEFGDKSWRQLLKDTEDALNLLFMEEAQSGIAKNIDREDKLAWLDKVAVNLYKYLGVQSIQIIHKFLFPAQDYPEVVINLPSTFVIKSESELIEDINKLRSQNAPDMIISQMMRQFVSKTFGGDPIRLKVFDSLIFMDPLALKTNAEKVNMQASGAVSEEDYRFSVYLTGVLENFARSMANFSDLSVEEIAAAVVPLVQAKIAITPRIEPRTIG